MASPTSPPTDPTEALRHALDHAAHLLPVQGPIGVFIHHNTLHAFQDKPFEEAVAQAAQTFGTEPYMSEAAYRAEIANDRILAEDIPAVVNAEPDAQIASSLTRRFLRRAMLLPGVRPITGQTVGFALDENDWLTRFRSDVPKRSDTPQALWEAVGKRLPAAEAISIVAPRRPADVVNARCGMRLDEIVHPPLIRLTSAYLDQGVAYWPMPLRDSGLLAGARHVLGHRMAVFAAHLEGAGEVFRDHQTRGLNAEATVLEQLKALAVPESEWEAFIVAELLALPGWAGMIHKLEQEPELAVHEPVKCSLMEFLALRLTFTAVAVKNLLGDASAWREALVHTRAIDPRLEQAQLFDAAQLVGADVASLSDAEFSVFRAEVNSCDALERRRLLHLAYERRHERRILIPLSKYRREIGSQAKEARPAAQVVFCIDEREESIRRALEEVNPQIETFGAAGFFGCAIDYTGIDDAHGVALCPVVVKPAHAVKEVPAPDHADADARRQSLRRAWAKLAHWDHVNSRSLVGGALHSLFLGIFSAVPLIVRVLRPLLWAKLNKKLGGLLLPEPATELAFLRDDAEARVAGAMLMQGFTTQEKVDRVAAVLGTMGMQTRFARLVLVLGHGSTSWNNPHESAHDCGACGGRRGGPNARLFAAMANRPEVREGLLAKGIVIPEDTYFLGGYHDTCSDAVDIAELDLVPASHQADLASLQTSVLRARELSAHERARRFEAADDSISPAQGLQHAQERSEHLAEPRPEYGHCTNAVCLVGRREFTRGLFFDRRAFLVSYNAMKDPANEALGRLLGAVIPVCGGISLEYYFSFVDNEGYGCGTKLPHNVTGLIGVMNGFQSDLRTGLPLQMVEIHEPVRILFVIETTPQRLMTVIDANPELAQFVHNRWIRLSTMDPDDGHIEVYRDGVFEPLTGDEEPLRTTPSSIAYYQGKMEHLPVARIVAKEGQAA